MRYFDLHCDTATASYAGSRQLLHSGLQVSLDKAAVFDSYCQLFAVFIPDELRGDEAAGYFQNVSDFFYPALAECPDVAMFGTNTQKPVHAILTVEGGSACGGNIDGLYHLRERGVAVMTLTWNGDNELASGCFAPEDRGITPFGKQALRVMKQIGIIPDVSHLGRKSFSQLCDWYDGVFIATHSNYDLTQNHSGKTRNLQPWQVREIRDRGGLIGVNFCSKFLGDSNDTGFDAVRRHLERFLEDGCENCLAFGSDFDGCQIHEELNDLQKVPALYEYLSQKGMEESLLDRIFYGNAFSFFAKQLEGFYDGFGNLCAGEKE